MMLVKSITVVLIMLFCACLADIIGAGGKEKQEESREGRTLRTYFGMFGIEVDSYNQDWVKLYDKSIIDAMDAHLQDPYFDFSSDGTLNKSIYRRELDKTTATDDDKLSLEEIAALNAIELIMPSDESKPAIEDLKRFVKEQPKLGSELLRRLVTNLEQDKLDYESAKHSLDGFYLRWIPLGRLNEFIATHAAS